MQLFNKVCILKEVTAGFCPPTKKISGIARVENESGFFTFSLSLINVDLVDTGEYFAMLFLPKTQPLFFSLGNKPISFTTPLEKNIDVNNFAVALVYICNFIPQMVAFNTQNDKTLSLSACRKSVVSLCEDLKLEESIKTTKTSEDEKDNYCPGAPTPPCPYNPVTVPKTPGSDEPIPPNNPYNDEVVVTENYYDVEIDESLKLIERLDVSYASNQNDEPSGEREEKTNKNGEKPFGIQDETNLPFGKKYGEQNPFYLSVKEGLDDLFLKFEREENLERLISESKWVKINYSGDKYYVVGVVSQNDKAKYICYGVPADYSATPPKELDGYCSFVPLSIFDVKGFGYFMMFQDAVTGECVKK